jgi:hypothetical protein
MSDRSWDAVLRRSVNFSHTFHFHPENGRGRTGVTSKNFIWYIEVIRKICDSQFCLLVSLHESTWLGTSSTSRGGSHSGWQETFSPQRTWQIQSGAWALKWRWLGGNVQSNPAYFNSGKFPVEDGSKIFKTYYPPVNSHRPCQYLPANSGVGRCVSTKNGLCSGSIVNWRERQSQFSFLLNSTKTKLFICWLNHLKSNGSELIQSG